MQSSPWHTSWILETGSVVDFGGGGAAHGVAGADAGVVADDDGVALHESELDVDIVDLACLGPPS